MPLAPKTSPDAKSLVVKMPLIPKVALAILSGAMVAAAVAQVLEMLNSH